MTPNQQAANEIHEDQLLHFLVNTLTGAFSLSLGENAEIDPDDIYGPRPMERELRNEDVWGIYKEPRSPWIYASDRNGGTVRPQIARVRVGVVKL